VTEVRVSTGDRCGDDAKTLEDLASAGGVAVDLVPQILERRERSVVTQTLQQMDFDSGAVQVVRRPEQVDFAARRGLGGPDRRPSTDVQKGGAWGRGVAEERASRVNAVLGQEDLRINGEIRGRIPERPTDPIPACHVADQDRRSAQHGGGPCDVTGGDEGSDARAADRDISEVDRWDDDDSETVPLAEGRKCLGIPGAARSEAKRRPDDDRRGVQSDHEHLLGESVRREVPDVVKRRSDDPVDCAEKQADLDVLGEEESTVWGG